MSTVFAPWEGYAESPGGLILEDTSTIYGKLVVSEVTTPFAVRRKSILSAVVHRKIRGVGFIFLRGSVDRLKNIKGLDVMMALKCISEEMRRSGFPSEAGVESASLEQCLAGFTEFANRVYRPIIPMPLTSNWTRWLYHDSGICSITTKCWSEGCEWGPKLSEGKDSSIIR